MKTGEVRAEDRLDELEIDREDIHGRSKLRRNVMKRESGPIRKRTTNR